MNLIRVFFLYNLYIKDARSPAFWIYLVTLIVMLLDLPSLLLGYVETSPPRQWPVQGQSSGLVPPQSVELSRSCLWRGELLVPRCKLGITTLQSAAGRHTPHSDSLLCFLTGHVDLCIVHTSRRVIPKQHHLTYETCSPSGLSWPITFTAKAV